MAIDDRMTSTALATAKTHVYNVCQTGDSITLIKPGTKDRLGTILTESTLPLKSHPVRFSPFSRETLQKISWSEKVDVIFYVSEKEIDLLSLTIKDLKHYTNVKHNNKDFEIKYVDSYSNFGGDFLYIIIGASI